MGLNQIGYKKVTPKNIIGDRTNTGGGSGVSVNVNSSTNNITCQYVTLVQTTLSGTQTIDGVSPSNESVILVANQTDASENGIYEYSTSGAWERIDGLQRGQVITITGGNTKQGSIWVVQTHSFEIGVDDISIIENAISRKDESFSLGFDAVSSLMSMDKFIIQASDNVLRYAEIDNIFDTYGARGDWDAVTIKTADTRVTGTTWGDVAEITIDLDADSQYEWELISLATTKVNLVNSSIKMDFLYSGTFEYGYFRANWGYSDSSSEVNNYVNFAVWANASGTDTTINPFQDITNGIIKTTTAGTLKAQIVGWNSTNIATLHAGSVFRVRKLDSFTNFQPSSGEANTGVNVGGEKEVYKSMSGTALQFRTLKEGTNVTLTQNTNDITIDVAGGGFYDGSVHCTADQSNNSTTLIDSTYLTIALDATSTYLVKAIVYMDDNGMTAQSSGKFAYTGTIDYSGVKIHDGTYYADITTANAMTKYGVAKGMFMEIDGMITTTTAGNLKIQFGLQYGTGTIYIRKGSIMYYKKVV